MADEDRAITTDTHTALRDGTSAEHRALEKHPLLRPLLRPDLEAGQYCSALHPLLHFYRRLEPALVPACTAAVIQLGAGNGYCYSPRTPLLIQDLKDMGQRPEPAPETRPLPDLSTPWRVLGVLYVLEGATQGGRVIAPRLARSLGIDGGTGARYFTIHNRDEGSSWRALTNILRGLDKPPQLELIAGARQAFTSLHQHMDAWHQATVMSHCP